MDPYEQSRVTRNNARNLMVQQLRDKMPYESIAKHHKMTVSQLHTILQAMTALTLFQKEKP